MTGKSELRIVVAILVLSGAGLLGQQAFVLAAGSPIKMGQTFAGLYIMSTASELARGSARKRTLIVCIFGILYWVLFGYEVALAGLGAPGALGLFSVTVGGACCYAYLSYLLFSPRLREEMLARQSHNEGAGMRPAPKWHKWLGWACEIVVFGFLAILLARNDDLSALGLPGRKVMFFGLAVWLLSLVWRVVSRTKDSSN